MTFAIGATAGVLGNLEIVHGLVHWGSCRRELPTREPSGSQVSEDALAGGRVQTVGQEDVVLAFGKGWRRSLSLLYPWILPMTVDLKLHQILMTRGPQGIILALALVPCPE